MIGEQSMATIAEIMDFRERLVVAFERDDAGREIVIGYEDYEEMGNESEDA